MRINDEEILSVAYDEDVEAELADARYHLALKRLTVSDVLATVDSLIASQSDERAHPLYHLAKHALTCGTYRTSGKRALAAERLSSVFEDLVQTAIDTLIEETLTLDGPWED
jgi:hypothetical protein